MEKIDNNNYPVRILIVDGKMICGGVESFIMNIYRHIDRTKIQFDFLVHYKEKFFYDDEIEKLGGTIYRLTFRNDNNYFKYKKDLKEFFLNHHYDIVWGHMDGLASIYLKVAKLCKVKYTIAHSHITSSEHSIKGLLKRILKRKICDYADFCFACSTEAGHYLYGKKKFYLMHNFIDASMFDYCYETRKKIRQQNNWGKEDIVIGMVGRFNKQKNHKFAIDLFCELNKKNSHYKFCLCGDGEMIDEIKEIAKKKNIINEIQFKGNILNINEYYQAFDILIMPSLYEGLPVSGVEAQTSGLKCVFSNNVTKEVSIVGENVCFLPIDNGIKKWADTIDQIKKYERKSKKKNILEAGYDINLEIKKIEFFLLKLTNEK